MAHAADKTCLSEGAITTDCSSPLTDCTPMKPHPWVLEPTEPQLGRLDTWLTGATLVSQQAAQHHWTWRTGSARGSHFNSQS